jgi:predicted Zn-dependent protease
VTSIQETLERVVSLSKADACIAVGWESSAANVRWANNTSTTNGVADSSQLYVISIIDKRVGTVGVSYFPDERLETLVRESEAGCEGKPEAEDHMPLVEGHGAAQGWESPHPGGGIEVFGELAPALGQTFARAEADGVELFGYAEHATSTVYLATSSGLRRRHTQLEGRMELNAKTPDFSRSAWVGQGTATFRDVDVPSLYGQLQQRLEWAKTTLELPPGRYQVLLTPSAVADMLVYAYWSSSARDADEGRTVFSRPGGGNRIAERLYPQGITVYSDPHEPGLEVAPFGLTVASSSYASLFDCGQPLQRTAWVEDGVLQALITTRHWAARSGSSRVTPYVGNLVFASQEGPSLDDMIASTRRALLVTCFWYIRVVDPQTLLLTGLTRDGVYLVEDGEVRGAVNNFRYNMSPVDMLAQAVEVGRAEPTLAREFGDYFRFAKMPPLRVDGFNMSSVSEST